MYYLKEEVYFEPLFNSWYAWPYLIAPVQGARHTVNTHRRIMKSFVNNYQLHILACQEPGITGAEFLNCTEDQLEDIKRLIDFIDVDCKDLVELSQAVKTLDELLAGHQTGESIEYLYEQVPKPLKGYVELFFDMQHNPSYRLIESLIYKSDYYKPQLQSVSFGMVSAEKQRPFVFSTPRLPDKDHVQIKLDFNSPILEKIFRSREIPLTEGELSEIIAVCECQGGLSLKDLFTTKQPSYLHQPVTDGVKLQYTGHAGFLIESKDVAILMDPVLPSRCSSYAGDVFSFSQLPEKIDYICLTHSHQDHVNL